MDFLTNLNLNKNELQNAVIQNLSVAPSNPRAGQIYYNSTDKMIYQFDDTNWISFGGQIDRLSSNPSNPKTNQVYYNTTDNVLKQYTGSAWVNISNYSTGTVTSIATGNGLTGGPITDNGTIELDTAYGDTVNPYGSKTANTVLAAPNGSAGTPSFRALVAADIPSTVKVGSASFADDSTNNSNNPIKLTIKDSQTTAGTLATANIPKVSSSSAGVVPKGSAVSTQSQTTKFLREDGTWAAPSYPDVSDFFKKDGSVTMTGALNMGSHKITNVTDPTNDQDAATKKYVDDSINALPKSMVFKGSVGSGGTVEWSALPAASSSNEGFTYKVITAHATDPICEVGDTIISNGSIWTVIPSGDEPSGTVTSVGIQNATNGGLSVSGSPITSSGTITIGLANNYGDTKNPYASKTQNYVLAAPSNDNGVPSFRALVSSDIPDLSLTYKTIQTAVSDPEADGNALAFIDTISQNTNGVIAVTKKNVNADTTPTEDSSNLVTSGGVYAAIQDLTGGAVHKKTVTNPALTASGGSWTWVISGSNALGTSDVTVTVYRVSDGKIVVPDVAVTQSGSSAGTVTITINDTAGATSLSAGTYKAVIVG